MKNTDYKSWINNIVSNVDTLEASYKSRLAIMAQEYQQDVEDMLKSYKIEKQRLLQELDIITNLLDQANEQLRDTQRLYKAETVEHKITKESLRNTRYEVVLLSSNSQTTSSTAHSNDIKQDLNKKSKHKPKDKRK